MSGRGLWQLVGSFFLLELATAMMFVALPLLMAERYGLGLQTGAVLAVALAPQLLFAGLVGIVIRRSDSCRVAIASALAGAAVVALFPLSATVVQVAALSFAAGATFVFGAPARMALRPRVMLAGSEVRGNSMIVAGERVAMTLGPALGAALVALHGIGSLFCFDAAVLVGAAALLVGIAGTANDGLLALAMAPERAVRWPHRLLIEPLAEFRELLRDEPLVAALTVTAFGYVTAVGASRLLLTSRAKSTFGADASLGLLVAAMAAGGVAGAAVGGRLGHLRQGRLYIAGNLCEALCWPIVALAHDRAIMLLAMFAAGIFESVPTVVYFAEVQTRLAATAVASYYALLIPLTQTCAMLGAIGGSALLALGGALPLAVAMACLIGLPVLARARILIRAGAAEARTESRAVEDAA